MQRTNEAFISNKEAADLLGVSKSNVHKMLVRYGVEGNLVDQGERKVRLYQRVEVERVRKARLTRQRKRRENGKQD